jgi:hypothetical protein
MAPEECPACGAWPGEEEEEVTFYPFPVASFLVVLEGGVESKPFCWMSAGTM